MSNQPLTERQRRERALHDQWADENEGELLIEASFEAPTAVENRFILSHFDDLSGQRVLDLGAGLGEASLYFAQRGAEVTAVDISEASIGRLRREAERRGLRLTATAKPAETLPFEDGAFDRVYGNGVLHHVELRPVIAEVKRVLRPGGRFAFIEPLAYNPAIWIYRKMAAQVRTPDERPLTRSDLEWICQQFPEAGHREFWLSALGLFVWFWLGERVAPAEDRYWKRVLRRGDRYGRALRPFFQLDRSLARVPGLRYLAWNTVIYGVR